MRTVLVVANETLGGRPLLEAVRARASEGDTRFVLVVPQGRPRRGGIIYDDAVRDAAQVRVDLARQFMGGEGIEVVGDVGDPDPFQATMDAVLEHRPDEIIISTHPVTQSGWLRRDLVERVANESGLPVDHVVSDIAAEGLPFTVTLVVANRTAQGEELLENLKARGTDGEHLFIVVVPQEGGQGHHTAAARERLTGVLKRLRSEGLLCAGMIADPDPYRATMNALEAFNVSDVVISTLPEQKSGWMRADLPERIAEDSRLPVEHVVVDPQASGTRA